MFKWLNPVWWWVGIKGAFEFVSINPAGFTFTWFASGLQTMWLSAFPVSLVYPNWARDIATEVLPAVKAFSVATWDVSREVFMTFWNTS